MSESINGTFFEDDSDDLNAAKLNKLNPHGFVYQTAGDGALEVSVMTANWVKNDASLQEYAGSSGNAVPVSVTRYIYLDASNALVVGASMPAVSNEYFFCAKVVSNGSEVTGIHNYNAPLASYRT